MTFDERQVQDEDEIVQFLTAGRYDQMCAEFQKTVRRQDSAGFTKFHWHAIPAAVESSATGFAKIAIES